MFSQHDKITHNDYPGSVGIVLEVMLDGDLQVWWSAQNGPGYWEAGFNKHTAQYAKENLTVTGNIAKVEQ